MMSWNFLRKPVTSKLYQPQDLDQATINANLALSVQLAEFNSAEACLKSLYLSMKKIQDHILCTGKFETKLTNDLTQSKLVLEDELSSDDQYCNKTQTLSSMIDLWRSIALSSNTLGENYVITLQRFVIDPMKRLKQAFTVLRSSIRDHEVKQNNLNKWQRKVTKYGDKRNTGTNLVRAEEARRQLSQAEADFSRSSQKLLQDLNQFLTNSSESHLPLVEAFAEAEVAFMEANRRLVKKQIGPTENKMTQFNDSYNFNTANSPMRDHVNSINSHFRTLDQLTICSPNCYK